MTGETPPSMKFLFKTSKHEHFFPGFYCNVDDAPISIYTSYVCPLGYYCPIGTEYGTQYGCPKGTYGTSTQLESANACSPCDPGKYCGSVGLSVVSGKKLLWC